MTAPAQINSTFPAASLTRSVLTRSASSTSFFTPEIKGDRNRILPLISTMLNIFITLLLIGHATSFMSISRRSSVLLSPLKVASFDLTPRVKTGTPKFITQIDLLYDSECPLCAMEVEFLKKRDYENKIRFTDLSSLDYNPIEHGNVKFADGMRKIRAILPDTNEVVTGVEVFRHVYRYHLIPLLTTPLFLYSKSESSPS